MHTMTFQQRTKAQRPLNAALCVWVCMSVCVCVSVCVWVCVCVYVPSFDQHVWYPSDSSSTRQPSLLTAVLPQPCLTARPLTEPPRGKRESRALTIYHAWALLAIQCQRKGVWVRREIMKLACRKTVLEKQRPAHVNTGSTCVHR